MDELSLVEEHLFSNDQQQNRKKKTINESITPWNWRFDQIQTLGAGRVKVCEILGSLYFENFEWNLYDCKKRKEKKILLANSW